MASLVKQHSSYYSQFYNPNRIPSRKRVALKPPTKTLLYASTEKLEKKHELGLFNAWSGFEQLPQTSPK